MELLTIFKLLLKNVRILIFIPIVAGVAAYIFTDYAPKHYMSTAKLATSFTTNTQIKISEQSASSYSDTEVKFNNMISLMGGELFMSALSYELIIHDLTSDQPFRNIEDQDHLLEGKSKQEIEEIVAYFQNKLDRMEILNLYIPYESMLDSLLEEYDYSPGLLEESLTIDRVWITDFVEVVFVSKEPNLSAFAVNTLCNLYIRYDSAQSMDLSGRSVVFFSNLVQEKKRILDEKTEALNNYKALHNLFNTEQMTINSTELTTLDANRRQQLNQIQRLNISISNIEGQLSNQGGTDVTLTDPSNKRIIELRNRISTLNQMYIDGGATDKELENKIIALRQILRREMEKLPATTSSPLLSREDLIAEQNRLKLELQIEEANLKTLNQNIRTLRSNVSASEQKEASLASLQIEAETASSEYLQAVEKFNMANNQALISDSPLKIIQMGQPNDKPESFQAGLIVGLAIVASFFLCVFAIIMIDYTDMRIRTPAKFKSSTGLEFLGNINLLRSDNVDLKETLIHNTMDENLDKNRQLLRKIRYELENSGAKVILFTSTKRGEGKTYILLSLAHSLSLLNKKILIIDTNFKNNTLTQILTDNTEPQKLLSNDNQVILSTNGKKTEEFGHGIIGNTENIDVDFIGTQTEFGSPSEIFAGMDFETFIDKARDIYDYIFMEGASLNEYSDTKELITYADKVLPVFSAYSVIKSVDKESIDFLKSSLNGKLMGSILNMTDAEAVE